MAKGSIQKQRKAPSAHSRAARRATSPSIDTDKSLKDVQLPADAADQHSKMNNRSSVLSIHQGAGVSKKMRKGRNLSSRARKRSDRAQDRAEEIADRTQTKVAKSKGQARVIQSRRKNWEDINKEVPQAAANKFAGLADEDDSAGDDGNDGKPAANAVKRSAFELDDEMGDAAPGPAADYIPLPEAVNEDDHDGIL